MSAFSKQMTFPLVEQYTMSKQVVKKWKQLKMCAYHMKNGFDLKKNN